MKGGLCRARIAAPAGLGAGTKRLAAFERALATLPGRSRMRRGEPVALQLRSAEAGGGKGGVSS